jgi:hypothetical protein
MTNQRCADRPRTGRMLALGRTLIVASALGMATPRATAAESLYSERAGTEDARFGSAVGAGSQWQSGLPSSAPSNSVRNANLAFGGGARLSCTGVDFNGFLRTFDPAELISEMRTSLLTGAQAAASNFLITLAYSNPTVSSVLDMLDKRYSARFNAFAQACNAQADRARGQEAGARTMADAGDECFGQEVARGTAPTEAYRRCSVLHTFDELDIPAAASLGQFLRKYTSINMTQELEALLALLPDQRIDNGNFQIRAPQITVAGMSDLLRGLARKALDRVDAGVDPGSIPACSAAAMLGRVDAPDGCLPGAAVALVTSPAFRGARLLSPASRTLFKDALSSQIALSAMYSNLVDLFQQAARIDASGASADAAQVGTRRQQLREAIGNLLGEVDAQAKAQDARATLVRSQMLALEQVEASLDTRGRNAAAPSQAPQFGMRDLLHLFAEGR